jgi:hypothetical protein
VTSALLTFSIRAYAAMLFLYPAELRRDFGGEILDVFREDLNHANSFRGIAGMLSVWACAFREFVRIALPAWAENRRVAVPCILFAFNEAVLTIPQKLIFTHRPMSLQFILATALWPSLLAALTALVVVILGQQCPLFPLQLGPDSCSKSAI